ncbi:non-ribosomal peptide synthetase [Legionella erythra]|uniref:non-ribosomal peptide synthetase n=1 Tax=Legionella erythra TaxID=448 RepID=UPI00138F0626|nr:non-ribosomal peptide synthetase [Legionella erythra]
MYDEYITNPDYPRDSSLVDLFKKQVLLYPDKIAVKCGCQALTYKELNTKANQLAWLLIELGVSFNEHIGISTDRSLEMIVGILAIVKVGGVYVPIDMSYPKKNKQLIIDHAQIRFFINTNKKAVSLDGVRVVGADEFYKNESLEDPLLSTHSESPAYINFTSGTTGLPKGIICTHRGIIRLIFNQNYISLSSKSISLNSATLAFDAATFEIWGPLLHGGTCILLDESILTSNKLANIIKNENINTFFITTALFNSLVDIDVNCFDGLKKILIGGEILSLNHVRKLYLNNDDIVAVNIYGPTENTTFTCFYPIPRTDIASHESTVPIGKPIAHTQITIMNEEGNKIEVPGVMGELFISGDGLAKGYLNQPNLTKNKFIVDPVTQIRMYKSGDYVRYREDGQIEYLGRGDSEVKINGYRINLHFIENHLNNSNIIKVAAVIDHTLSSGLKILVAFVVGNKKDDAKLRKYLEEHIPAYMIPHRIIWNKSLPLGKTGKVDRNYLAKKLSNYQKFNKAIFNSLEEELISIWCRLLGLALVKQTDNFFHLGGNSLLLMHLDAEIQNRYHHKINVDDFYKNPTINELKYMITNASNSSQNKEGLSFIPLLVNLAPNQQRFLKQYNIDLCSTNMNIIFSVRVHTPISDKFVSAVKDYLLSLRLFRTTLVKQNDQLMLSFDPDKTPPIDLIYSEVFPQQELSRQEIFEMKYFFNLFKETPLRLKIYVLKNEVCFLFNIHHLYFDGASMEQLKRSIHDMADGKNMTQSDIDYFHYCKQSNLGKNNNNIELVQKFKERYDSKIFSFSDKTSKNISSPAEGYQVYIDKKHSKILGIAKFLYAFEEAIHQIYGLKEICCQIPISRNKVGEYANVIGYFVEVIIFHHLLIESELLHKKIENIEQSFHDALSFIGVNFLSLSPPESKFDFSSILFNYIPTQEPIETISGYFSYEKKFYRELLVFVFEGEEGINLKLIFNRLFFTQEDMKNFTDRFKQIVCGLLETHLDV